MNTYILSPMQILEEWSEIKPQLERVIEETMGETTLGEYQYKIGIGQMQVWKVLNCTRSLYVVTQVHPMWGGKLLIEVRAAAGEGLDLCLIAIKEIEKFAKAVGASWITICGRYGWKKVLKDEGYKNTYLNLMKEV